MRSTPVPGDAAHREAGAQGQILVVFALGIVALLLMAGLVFDGAQALTLRRQLQDASDAAALAAANLIQTGSTKGCSATPGNPPGAPRTEITAAAVAMIQTNIPGFPADRIHVSCPGGWSNYAVQVRIDDRSQGYFGGVAGFNGFGVGAESQALNGQITQIKYSIVELDPGNPSWPNGRRGCPSVLISGGPTILLEGSMMIDSACTAAMGGPLGTNGNAASLTLLYGGRILMVGTYSPGTLTLTPTPLSGQTYVKDPLLGLTTVPVASLPVRSNARLTINSDTLLEPGVYVGGIQMRNSARAYMRPGIYAMRGGGFDIGAQNAVYSIAGDRSSTTDANWAADCPDTTCGVLLFNTGITGSTDQIAVGAGATLKLRPYVASADRTGLRSAEYENLLMWQDGSPVPTSSFAQPVVSLTGGGSVDISGTVYAPSALVKMGGNAGGSGGSSVDLTLQFISWNLELQGNSSFHFYYRNDEFARPTDYGLIK